MEAIYLVSSLVTDKNDKRAMIFFDIVVDERRYPMI